MARSIAMGNKAWWGAVTKNSSLRHDQETGRRETERLTQRHTGNSLGFWNPQRHTSSNKTTPSNPSQKVPPTEPSIQIYKPMGAVVIQTTLIAKSNNVVKSQVWLNYSLNSNSNSLCYFLYLSMVKKYLSMGSKYNLKCLWYMLPCMCM